MRAKRTAKGSDPKRKSEVVTVRLDPKLKYVAELAARRQRRTLSSYIEWAIEDSLSRVHPSYAANFDEYPTFKEKMSDLWDVDEPDRLVKLAFNYPELLDHEEQRIWKMIRECGFLWNGSYKGPNKTWQWEIQSHSLIPDRLRATWDTFRSVARGEKSARELPSWKRTEPPSDDEMP